MVLVGSEVTAGSMMFPAPTQTNPEGRCWPGSFPAIVGG
jgi:hypothetical protein